MKYRVAVAVLALFAVACGSSGGGGTPGELASGPAASITTVSLAVASTTTGLDEVTETTAVAESLTVRVVEHAFGTTEVPNSPERILILDAGTILPVLLFLGVENIVGAPLPDGPINVTRLLSNYDLDGIESIGFPDENPELMAAMRPDLIIGFDSGLQETFDVYSRIAPTVAVEHDLTDWRGSGVRIAAAVGREAEMIEELAAYDARVADLQAAIGDPAGVETTIVRALGPLEGHGLRQRLLQGERRRARHVLRGHDLELARGDASIHTSRQWSKTCAEQLGVLLKSMPSMDDALETKAWDGTVETFHSDQCAILRAFVEDTVKLPGDHRNFGRQSRSEKLKRAFCCFYNEVFSIAIKMKFLTENLIIR